MTNEERLERARKAIERLEEMKGENPRPCTTCRWQAKHPDYPSLYPDRGCSNPLATAASASSTPSKGVVVPERVDREEARRYYGACGPEGLLWEAMPPVYMRPWFVAVSILVIALGLWWAA